MVSPILTSYILKVDLQVKPSTKLKKKRIKKKKRKVCCEEMERRREAVASLF